MYIYIENLTTLNIKTKTKNINNYIIIKETKMAHKILMIILFTFNFGFLVIDVLFDFFE